MSQNSSFSVSGSDSATQNPSFSEPEVLSPTIPETLEGPEHALWGKEDCLGYIVKKLWNDRPSLKQCSAASRAFREACRPRMYISLDIRLEENQVPRLQILNEIMSKNKEVVSQLQNLSLSSALRCCSLDQVNLDFLNRFLNFFLGELLLVEQKSRETREHLASSRPNSRTVVPLPGLRALNIVHLEWLSWLSMKSGTNSMVYQLLTSASQLHTVVTPFCIDWIHLTKTKSGFFFDMVQNKTSLRHLFSENSLRFWPGLNLQKTQQCRSQSYESYHHFIKIRRLHIKNSDYRTEYLFHLQLPLDPEKERESYFRRVWDDLGPQILMELAEIDQRRIRSIIWLFGTEWENWASQYHWQPFEPISILESKQDASPSPSERDAKENLRYLTFGACKSGKFRIDLAFLGLHSRFKIRTNDVEVLNLAYHVEAHGLSFWSPAKRALVRADQEFGSILAMNKLPSLRKVNLFLALSDAHLDEWKSFSTNNPNLSRSKKFPGLIRLQNSIYCSMSQKYAPNIYKIEKFSLMAGAVADGGRDFLERASIKNKCR